MRKRTNGKAGGGSPDPAPAVEKPRKKPRWAQPLCSTSRQLINEARERAKKASENPDLAVHAAMIRRLGKRVIGDIIEIGGRLSEAKNLIGHGGWEAWLQQEFGWSADTALNFMRVYELSEDPKSRNFRDLMIAPSALYLLARKGTPEAVRTEIIERAKAGEDITLKEVKALIAEPAVTEETKSETETEQTIAASPTNDWREDLRRGFRNALKVANDAIRIGQQAHAVRIGDAVITPELRAQVREALEPLRGQLPEVKKGGQALLAYFDLIENILTEGEPLVLAEAAE